MGRPVVLVLVGLLLLAGCGRAQDDAADRSASPATEPSDEQIVIRTRMVVAAEEGAEPIATGKVLEGSTLGGSPFCVAGTIVDSHASGDPAVEPYGLIDRTITCPDGTVRVAFTPEMAPPGQPRTGSWTILSGTGAYEGIRGTGEMEIVKESEDSPELETLTGTATR